MLKAFLQLSNIQFSKPSEEAFEKIEKYENLIMTRLMIVPDDFSGSKKKAARKAQFKSFECLSLIMILNKETFIKHVGMLIGYI